MQLWLRRISLATLVLVSAALMACGGGGGSGGPTPDRNVTATLEDAQGSPLANVTVTIDGEETEITTNENGQFQISRSRLESANTIGAAVRQGGSMVQLAEQQASPEKSSYRFKSQDGDSPAGQRVSGTVTEAGSGSPIQAAQVVLVQRGEGDSVYHTRTSGNGEYSFSGVGSGDALMLAFKDGYRPSITQVTIPEEAFTKDFRLESTGSEPVEGTTVTGTVTDAQSGQPVADAQVELFIFPDDLPNPRADRPTGAPGDDSPESGAGAAPGDQRPNDPRFGPPGTRGSGQTNAYQPGRSSSETGAGATPGDTEPGASMPAPSRFYRTTRTDADGNFIFEGVEGSGADVYVTKENYRPARDTVTLNRDRVETDLELRPITEVQVTGTVTNETAGEPVPDARVVFSLVDPAIAPGASPEDAPAGAAGPGAPDIASQGCWMPNGRPQPWVDFLFETTTDSNGEYQLTMPTGKYVAVAMKRGFESSPERVEVTQGQTEFDLTLREPRAGTVSGKVTDSEDNPVSGAEVRLVPHRVEEGVSVPGSRQTAQNGSGGGSVPGSPGRPPIAPRQFGLSDITQDNGDFTLRHVPKGTWTMVVSHRAFRPWEQRIEVRHEETTTVNPTLEARDLPEAVVLEGTVTDGESGEPVPGAELWLTYPAEGPRPAGQPGEPGDSRHSGGHGAVVGGQATADRNGDYRMRVIDRGDWVLHVRHHGYKHFRQQLTLTDNTEFDVQLTPVDRDPEETHQLSGKVVTESNGDPVPYATVGFLRRGVPVPMTSIGFPTPPQSRDITDANGEFSIELPEGEWMVVPLHPNYESKPDSSPVTVDLTEDSRVEPTLRARSEQPYSAITGTVTDAADDSAVAGARVWLADAGPAPMPPEAGQPERDASVAPRLSLHRTTSLRDGRYVLYARDGDHTLKSDRRGYEPFSTELSLSGEEVVRDIELEVE